MRNKFISSLAGTVFSFAANGFAFAADMPVKAPPPAPAPVPYSWTGFYGGIQFGGAWSDEAVKYSPNDALTAEILAGTHFGAGEQPTPNGFRIPQSGLVGGVEAGYNWQWSNWLLGVEADFSFTGMRGSASGASVLTPANFGLTQTTTADQSTDWYGTVRGRAGWLATPNLLLFGTGGFAYGRVTGSANWAIVSPPFNFPFDLSLGSASAQCVASGVPCFVGSSSEIRTGWTAGGGIEWLLDQHWSAKIEYQFVDLGTETVRITASIAPFAALGQGPASFNAAFHDRFNVVRVGLNYRFW